MHRIKLYNIKKFTKFSFFKRQAMVQPSFFVFSSFSGSLCTPVIIWSSLYQSSKKINSRIVRKNAFFACIKLILNRLSKNGNSIKLKRIS